LAEQIHFGFLNLKLLNGMHKPKMQKMEFSDERDDGTLSAINQGTF
jgi:hypothetical protein